MVETKKEKKLSKKEQLEAICIASDIRERELKLSLSRSNGKVIETLYRALI